MSWSAVGRGITALVYALIGAFPDGVEMIRSDDSGACRAEKRLKIRRLDKAAFIASG